MEWSKDKTTRIIELFRDKRVLWDPTAMGFKDRSKKHEAWAELGAEIEIDVFEVEKKVRMLIGQFRREIKKGKRGDEADAPYKSKWIFFNKLQFLIDKNESHHSTEDAGFSHASTEQTQDEDTKNIPLIECDGVKEELHQEILSVSRRSKKTMGINIPQKNTMENAKRKADTIVEDAYAVMKNLSSYVKERDEFDVFGELVAHTLRNLKCRSSQSHAKFEIGNILYRAEMNGQ